METKNPVYTLDEETLQTLAARRWDDQTLGFGDRWNAAAAERERALLNRIKTTYAAMTRLGMIIQQDSVTLYNTRALRAPISRVPDDVLRLIFEDKADILQRGPSMPFQVVCSLVCRRWRRVAFETAYLWSRLGIDNGRSLNFASRYLTQRCPTAPIELELHLKCSASRAKDVLVKKLADFLSTHAPRLSRLRLDMCAHSVTQLWTVGTCEFPALETIILSFQRSNCKAPINVRMDWKREGLLPASAVRRLRFTACDLPTNLVPFPGILSLAVEILHVEQTHWNKFLRSFPNIHELRLQHVSILCGTLSDLHSDAPVALNQLHKIEVLNSDSKPWWDSFCLHAPHLQQLIFSNHGSHQPILSLLQKQVALTHVSLSLPWTAAKDVNERSFETSPRIAYNPSGSDQPARSFHRAASLEPSTLRVSREHLDDPPQNTWLFVDQYGGSAVQPGTPIEASQCLPQARRRGGCVVQRQTGLPE